MPHMYENLGIGQIFEDNDTATGIIGYVAKKGKVFPGYGDTTYIYKDTGSSELWLTITKKEDGQKVLDCVHTHGGNRLIWELVHNGIEINSKDSSDAEHIAMFEKADGTGGMIPIDVINADVLPSFMDGDRIKLQVIAYPLEINYYKDEDEFAEAQPEDEHGKKWLVNTGALLPLHFLSNHIVKEDGTEDSEQYDTDMLVTFSAKVTRLYGGTFAIEGNGISSYICCFADTDFGELEFDHSVEQVPEEQRKNIQEGAISAEYA